MDSNTKTSLIIISTAAIFGGITYKGYPVDKTKKWAILTAVIMGAAVGFVADMGIQQKWLVKK